MFLMLWTGFDGMRDKRVGGVSGIASISISISGYHFDTFTMGFLGC